MGSTSAILLLTFVGVAIVLVVTIVILRRNGSFGPSRVRHAQAAALMQTGEKARALILAVRPIGMVANDVGQHCIVSFRLDPLSGGEPFEVQKKVLVSPAWMPRVGEVWPSWFDRLDPLQFVVGQPSAVTPEQVGMFREFGIPHPLDRQVP